jgi:molybdenum cofactor cytidylyltransferase
MPRITPAILDRLIDTFETAERPPDAVGPVRRGRRGNPVRLGRAVFARAAALLGDQGARGLLDDAPAAILACEIDDAAIEIDVDTLADLAALQRGDAGSERLR